MHSCCRGWVMHRKCVRDGLTHGLVWSFESISWNLMACVHIYCMIQLNELLITYWWRIPQTIWAVMKNRCHSTKYWLFFCEGCDIIIIKLDKSILFVSFYNNTFFDPPPHTHTQTVTLLFGLLYQCSCSLFASSHYLHDTCLLPIWRGRGFMA